MKEAERRIWVIRERPPEPQPKPLAPQPSPSPSVPREGDGALCEEVMTGECMWSPPPSVRNVLSQCGEGGHTVNLRGCCVCCLYDHFSLSVQLKTYLTSFGIAS